MIVFISSLTFTIPSSSVHLSIACVVIHLALQWTRRYSAYRGRCFTYDCSLLYSLFLDFLACLFAFFISLLLPCLLLSFLAWLLASFLLFFLPCLLALSLPSFLSFFLSTMNVFKWNSLIVVEKYSWFDRGLVEREEFEKNKSKSRGVYSIWSQEKKMSERHRRQHRSLFFIGITMLHYFSLPLFYFLRLLDY